MPKGTKVAKCVEDVMAQGKSKVSAIKICQKSTGMSYATGKKSKSRKTTVRGRYNRRKLKGG
uniref:Uncharacterized protein n=1 Tax=viral metagenome TaxID=1070528 RepID=A0A6M3LHU7_9ZZZZ